MVISHIPDEMIRMDDQGSLLEAQNIQDATVSDESSPAYLIPTLTCFFRSPEAFGTLRNVCLPSLSLQQRVRIASVGCSNGKEPYSALVDNWHERERLIIDGYDINREQLRHAREGKYSLRPFETEYFEVVEEDGGCFIFSEEQDFGIDGEYTDFSVLFTQKARKHVQFKEGDILKERLLKEYDIIFLMNVLFHYTRKEQETILRNVRESLSFGGWLFPGSLDYLRTGVMPSGFAEEYISAQQTGRKGYFVWRAV